MPQGEIPLAGSLQYDFDLELLKRTFSIVQGSETPINDFARFLTEEPSAFTTTRAFLGISDKRAYLDLSYVASRILWDKETGRGICGCFPWEMARHTTAFFLNFLSRPKRDRRRSAIAAMLAGYLCDQGLSEIAAGLRGTTNEILSTIREHIIAPREAQQRAAKLRGHGCEAALARVVRACGVSFVPRDKDTNPMGAVDPHVDLSTLRIGARVKDLTHSFDLVVLGESRDVRVVIQSLVHTSDPGQYGVNKSNETVEIHQKIQQTNQRQRHGRNRVEHWALLDGVGFSENKVDTLNKMLGALDHFVQLNTLYKVPLKLHSLGLCDVGAIRFDADYYGAKEIDAITEKYVTNGVKVVLDGRETRERRGKGIRCGRAKVWLGS